MTVSTTGDTDGDGIPDDIELANGLDPNDPIDAFEDADTDGLSNLEEYQLGSNIQLADTDGDGINDGEETLAGQDGFITNPLLADTDGDGLNDGLEVQVGSSPTDANDANFAAVLTGIELTPDSANLPYNTIDGETTIQLTVIGTLTDGSTADLTNLNSVNYNSSDLSVANFGVEKGKVFAGIDGVAQITASIGGYEDSSRMTVFSFAPRVRGLMAYPKTLSDVTAHNGHAYLHTYSGIPVISVQNPDNPGQIAELPLSGTVTDIVINKTTNILYAASSTGLYLFDISDPVQAASSGYIGQLISVTNGNLALSADGTTLYNANGGNGLITIDVTDNTNPQTMSTTTGITATAIATDGNSLVIATGSSVVRYDISNPQTPVLQDTTNEAMNLIQLRGQYAYGGTRSDRYKALDLNNTSTPKILEGQQFRPLDISLVSRHAFYGDVLFTSAIPYLNVTIPVAPCTRALSTCPVMATTTALAWMPMNALSLRLARRVVVIAYTSWNTARYKTLPVLPQR